MATRTMVKVALPMIDLVSDLTEVEREVLKKVVVTAVEQTLLRFMEERRRSSIEVLFEEVIVCGVEGCAEARKEG